MKNVLIITEAGVNHNVNNSLAKQLMMLLWMQVQVLDRIALLTIKF